MSKPFKLDYNGTEVVINEIIISDPKKDENDEEYCDIEIDYAVSSEEISHDDPDLMDFIKEEIQKLIDLAIENSLDILKQK
jgi:hypothetical protein